MTMLKNDGMGRRKFVKATAAGAASLGFFSTARSYARIIGANDRVSVGIVGFSDRTKDALLPAFMGLAKELNFEARAVSDIWKLRREEGVAHLSSKYQAQTEGVRNNDELYARKDIDAVIIGT